jgi:hypothetical protein
MHAELFWRSARQIRDAAVATMVPASQAPADREAAAPRRGLATGIRRCTKAPTDHTKSELLNRWLSLAANIGVMGGLVLVAIRINQNTGIAQAQILNDYHLADMQLELAMMAENPAQSWEKAVYMLICIAV